MSELFALVHEGTDYSYEDLQNAINEMTPEVFAKKVVIKAMSENNFSHAFVGINKALSLSQSKHISAVVEELNNELLVFKFGYEPIQYLKMLLIGDSLLPYRNVKPKSKNKKKSKKNTKRR